MAEPRWSIRNSTILNKTGSNWLLGRFFGLLISITITIFGNGLYSILLSCRSAILDLLFIITLIDWPISIFWYRICNQWSRKPPSSQFKNILQVKLSYHLIHSWCPIRTLHKYQDIFNDSFYFALPNINFAKWFFIFIYFIMNSFILPLLLINDKQKFIKI